MDGIRRPDAVAGIGLPSWSGHGMTARRERDLIVTTLGDRSLVVACDSNAATGDKPGDHIRQSPVVTGYSAAKVPLMEVLAAGAEPFLLVDNLGVDLETTGRDILRGIARLLDESGLELMVTGSDESNMPTVQTGVGVTVIGVAETAALRLGAIRAGDEIWVAGRRRSGLPGDEYAEGDGGTATVRHVAAALALPDVHEVLPVGSRGVAFEASELGRLGGVGIELLAGIRTDLVASAGASTCFLVACAPGTSPELASIGLPTELIGHASSDSSTRPGARR